MPRRSDDFGISAGQQSELSPFDHEEYQAAVNRMIETTQRFSGAFATAMRDAVIRGNDFEEALNRVGMRLSSLALDQALQPLQRSLSDLMSANTLQTRQQGSAIGSAGFDGRQIEQDLLAPQLNMNIQTNDAASFRNSRGQLFAALAGLMSQGMRNL